MSELLLLLVAPTHLLRPGSIDSTQNHREGSLTRSTMLTTPTCSHTVFFYFWWWDMCPNFVVTELASCHNCMARWWPLPVKPAVLLKVLHMVMAVYSTGRCHPKPAHAALHATPHLPSWSPHCWDKRQFKRVLSRATPYPSQQTQVRDFLLSSGLEEEDGQHHTDDTQGSLRRQSVF